LTGYNRFRCTGTYEAILAGYGLIKQVACALLKLLWASQCGLKRHLKMYNGIIWWIFMGLLPSMRAVGEKVLI